MPLATGTQFGRYEIRSQLGAGGIDVAMNDPLFMRSRETPKAVESFAQGARFNSENAIDSEAGTSALVRQPFTLHSVTRTKPLPNSRKRLPLAIGVLLESALTVGSTRCETINDIKV